MKKDAIRIMPQYFDRYINLVGDLDVTTALEKFGDSYLRAEYDSLVALGDRVYEPGKWTVNDIIQHIIDAERVFAYRAMRISRADKTPLPGFDENDYALHTNAANRTLDDLLYEYNIVRESSLALFKSCTDAMLLNEGTASGKEVSVLALGFIIPGHAIHHVNVLKERYYPLLAGK